MMCYSIPVFPALPGRRERILSLEISRDYGPTFYNDYERGNQVMRVDLVAMHCTLLYTLL
jgi:hypothetical protein